MSHQVQLFEIQGKRRRDKITPKLVLHTYKSISLHKGTNRCNISRKHVTATYVRLLFLLHVPATRYFYMSPHCALLFCRCKMSVKRIEALEALDDNIFRRYISYFLSFNFCFVFFSLHIFFHLEFMVSTS